MKLTKIRIDHFRNILDSGEVRTEPGITCLVGKNESGKTAFLQALYRMNPDVDTPFDVHQHYPAWLEKTHRLQKKDPTKVFPVTVTFALEDDDKTEFVEEFGDAVKDTVEVVLKRQYDGSVDVSLKFDEAAWIREFIEEQCEDLFPGDNYPNTAKDLDDQLQDLSSPPQEEGADQSKHQRAIAVRKVFQDELGSELCPEIEAQKWIQSRLPQFFYFDNFSQLPGIIDIQRVSKTDVAALSPEERTAKSLLTLAYAETDIAMGVDYERRKRELENTANALTLEVLEYWSQNPDIRVEVDFNQALVNDAPPVVKELHVRLYDNAHMLSLPFDERSSGFRWFFSFLCAFSKYRMSGESVILLLDEPALGLHAKAQSDFLRFIEEKLAPTCQVIYTTHSPFMVPPGHLERVRLVEDKGKKQGASVSEDIMTTDADTLFPLQGALGYDLAQNLFVGPHNLVVEGTSDFTYLQILSNHLRANDREGLDERWVIVPVGGADQVATFAALLGRHADTTILLDSHPRGNQRLDRLTQQQIFERSRIIGVGEIISKDEADIEDLFEPSEYLVFFNEAFGKTVGEGDLKGNDPIVKQLARELGKRRYDHGRPAEVLLRKGTTLVDTLSDDTLDRFEQLFQKINGTIPT